MQSNYKEDLEFQDEVLIFAYEMMSYTFVRRSFLRDATFCTQPVENSQFTEEIGKAVLVTWHKFVKKYRQILSDDFPKYLPTEMNYVNYALFRCLDLLAHSDSDCFAEPLLQMMAFLLEQCYYCFEKKQSTFASASIRVLITLFVFRFYDIFKYGDGWTKLREGCLTRSRQYDKENAEKDLPEGLKEFTLSYFMPNDDGRKMEFVPATVFRRRVTSYPIVDPKTHMMSLPKNVVARSRKGALRSMILEDVVVNPQPERHETMKESVLDSYCWYIYFKLRKWKVCSEMVTGVKNALSETKRNATKVPQEAGGEDSRLVFGDLRKLDNSETLLKIADGLTGIRKRKVTKLDENCKLFVGKIADRS